MASLASSSSLIGKEYSDGSVVESDNMTKIQKRPFSKNDLLLDRSVSKSSFKRPLLQKTNDSNTESSQPTTIPIPKKVTNSPHEKALFKELPNWDNVLKKQMEKMNISLTSPPTNKETYERLLLKVCKKFGGNSLLSSFQQRLKEELYFDNTPESVFNRVCGISQRTPITFEELPSSSLNKNNLESVLKSHGYVGKWVDRMTNPVYHKKTDPEQYEMMKKYAGVYVSPLLYTFRSIVELQSEYQSCVQDLEFQRSIDPDWYDSYHPLDISQKLDHIEPLISLRKDFNKNSKGNQLVTSIQCDVLRNTLKDKMDTLTLLSLGPNGVLQLSDMQDLEKLLPKIGIESIDRALELLKPFMGDIPGITRKDFQKRIHNNPHITYKNDKIETILKNIKEKDDLSCLVQMADNNLKMRLEWLKMLVLKFCDLYNLMVSEDEVTKPYVLNYFTLPQKDRLALLKMIALFMYVYNEVKNHPPSESQSPLSPSTKDGELLQVLFEYVKHEEGQSGGGGGGGGGGGVEVYNVSNLNSLVNKYLNRQVVSTEKIYYMLKRLIGEDTMSSFFYQDKSFKSLARMVIQGSNRVYLLSSLMQELNVQIDTLVILPTTPTFQEKMDDLTNMAVEEANLRFKIATVESTLTKFKEFYRINSPMFEDMDLSENTEDEDIVTKLNNISNISNQFISDNPLSSTVSGLVTGSSSSTKRKTGPPYLHVAGKYSKFMRELQNKPNDYREHFKELENVSWETITLEFKTAFEKAKDERTSSKYKLTNTYVNGYDPFQDINNMIHTYTGDRALTAINTTDIIFHFMYHNIVEECWKQDKFFISFGDVKIDRSDMLKQLIDYLNGFTLIKTSVPEPYTDKGVYLRELEMRFKILLTRLLVDSFYQMIIPNGIILNTIRKYNNIDGDGMLRSMNGWLNNFRNNYHFKDANEFKNVLNIIKGLLNPSEKRTFQFAEQTILQHLVDSIVINDVSQDDSLLIRSVDGDSVSLGPVNTEDTVVADTNIPQQQGRVSPENSGMFNTVKHMAALIPMGVIAGVGAVAIQHISQTATQSVVDWWYKSSSKITLKAHGDTDTLSIDKSCSAIFEKYTHEDGTTYYIPDTQGKTKLDPAYYTQSQTELSNIIQCLEGSSGYKHTATTQNYFNTLKTYLNRNTAIASRSGLETTLSRISYLSTEITKFCHHLSEVKSNPYTDIDSFTESRILRFITPHHSSSSSSTKGFEHNPYENTDEAPFTRNKSYLPQTLENESSVYGRFYSHGGKGLLSEFTRVKSNHAKLDLKSHYEPKLNPGGFNKCVQFLETCCNFTSVVSAHGSAFLSKHTPDKFINWKYPFESPDESTKSKISDVKDKISSFMSQSVNVIWSYKKLYTDLNKVFIAQMSAHYLLNVFNGDIGYLSTPVLTGLGVGALATMYIDLSGSIIYPTKYKEMVLNETTMSRYLSYITKLGDKLPDLKIIYNLAILFYNLTGLYGSIQSNDIGSGLYYSTMVVVKLMSSVTSYQQKHLTHIVEVMEEISVSLSKYHSTKQKEDKDQIKQDITKLHQKLRSLVKKERYSLEKWSNGDYEDVDIGKDYGEKFNAAVEKEDMVGALNVVKTARDIIQIRKNTKQSITTICEAITLFTTFPEIWKDTAQSTHLFVKRIDTPNWEKIANQVVRHPHGLSQVYSENIEAIFPLYSAQSESSGSHLPMDLHQMAVFLDGLNPSNAAVEVIGLILSSYFTLTNGAKIAKNTIDTFQSWISAANSMSSVGTLYENHKNHKDK